MIYYYNSSDIIDKLWADKGEFDKEVGTSLFSHGFGESFCNICGFLTCFTLIIYTLFSGFMIIADHRYNKLPEENMRRKYKILIDGSRRGGLAPKLHNISYMIRRFIVVSVIIFMQGHPDFQIVVLLETSFLNLCYLVTVKPYENKRQNSIDIFNEALLFFSYIIVKLYEMHFES